MVTPTQAHAHTRAHRIGLKLENFFVITECVLQLLLWLQNETSATLKYLIYCSLDFRHTKLNEHKFPRLNNYLAFANTKLWNFSLSNCVRTHSVSMSSVDTSLECNRRKTKM